MFMVECSREGTHANIQFFTRCTIQRMKSHLTLEAPESYRYIIQWWHLRDWQTVQEEDDIWGEAPSLILKQWLHMVLCTLTSSPKMSSRSLHFSPVNSVNLKKPYDLEKAEAKSTCQSSLLLLFFHIKNPQRNLSFYCNMGNPCNTW